MRYFYKYFVCAKHDFQIFDMLDFTKNNAVNSKLTDFHQYLMKLLVEFHLCILEFI